MNVHPQKIDLSYKIGQYLVYPGHGLCVASDFETMDVAGANHKIVRLRLLADPTTSFMKPVRISGSSGPRPPAGPEEWEDVFGIFKTKGKKASGGNWSLRKEAYESEIAGGTVQGLADVAHSILGWCRHARYEDHSYEAVPNDVEVSYSEREIAQKAIDLLAEEYGHVTGKSLRQARRIILSFILDPKAFEKIKPEFLQPFPVTMPNATFKTLFGLSIKDAAAKTEGKPAIVISEKMFRTPVNDFGPSVFSTGRTYKRFSGPGLESRQGGNGRSGQKRLAAGKEHRPSLENQDVFRAEQPFVAAKGVARKFFMAASRTLPPQEFEILSMADLRHKDRRISLEKIAQEKKIKLEDVIALRNAGAEKLRAALSPLSKKLAVYSAVNPYSLPQKALRVAKGKGNVFIPRVDLKDIYAAEPSLVTKGPGYKIMIAANDVLSVEEFALLAATKMKPAAKRMSLRTYAAHKGISLQQAAELHNEAVRKVKEKLQSEKSKFAAHKLLDPVVVKEKPEKAVKSARQPRAPKLAKSLKSFVPREDLKEILASSNHVAAKGPVFAIMRAANDVLTVEEFRLMVQTKFRGVYTVGVPFYARSQDMPVGRAVEIHNEAVRKLKEKLQSADPALAGHKILDAIAVKERRVKPVRMPRVAKEPKVKVSYAPRKETRDVYAAETGMIAIKGPIRSLFHTAEKTLDAKELSVLSQSEFRQKEHRLPVARIAAGLGVTVEEAIAIRNVAAEKVKNACGGLHGRMGHYAAINPYVAKTVRVRREKPVLQQFVLKEDLRAIYESEKPLLPVKGPVALLVGHAGEVLSRAEYVVLLQANLRKTVKTRALPKIAEEGKVSVEGVIDIRNTAARKLREHLEAKDPALAQHKALDPYVAKEKPKTVKIAFDETLPETIRDIFRAETNMVARFGKMRQVFTTGACVLSPQEFEAMAQTGMRGDNKLSREEYAKAKGIDVDDVNAALESASAKLQKAFADAGKEMPKLRFFKPQQEKANAPWTVEADIVDGELRLSLKAAAGILSASKGLRVEASWLPEQQGVPQSMKLEIKVAGRWGRTTIDVPVPGKNL